MIFLDWLMVLLAFILSSLKEFTLLVKDSFFEFAEDIISLLDCYLEIIVKLGYVASVWGWDEPDMQDTAGEAGTNS